MAKWWPLVELGDELDSLQVTGCMDRVGPPVAKLFPRRSKQAMRLPNVSSRGRRAFSSFKHAMCWSRRLPTLAMHTSETIGLAFR